MSSVHVNPVCATDSVCIITYNHGDRWKSLISHGQGDNIETRWQDRTIMSRNTDQHATFTFVLHTRFQYLRWNGPEICNPLGP